MVIGNIGGLIRSDSEDFDRVDLDVFTGDEDRISIRKSDHINLATADDIVATGHGA